MTGWVGSSFSAVNDPTISFEGDHYFFSQASNTAYNGVGFNQMVDVSAYTGSILDVDVTTAYKYQTGQRWGKDENGNSYLYDWKASFGINAYSEAGFLFGIGTNHLQSKDTWDTYTISLNWRSDWETKRDTLSEIRISGGAMYIPATSGDPGSWKIKEWGAWVGSEPTFVGFDSFEVLVETEGELVPVPVPGTALLGFIGLATSSLVLRRRRRQTA